jgi:hypothetical protein
MSKGRKKKSKPPVNKPGRGIRRSTGLVNWATRPERRAASGALELGSSPLYQREIVYRNPQANLRLQSPARLEVLGSPIAESDRRLEAIGSPLAETARRLVRNVSERIATPFYYGDTAFTNFEVGNNDSPTSTEDQESNREQEIVSDSALRGFSPGESILEHNCSEDSTSEEPRSLFGLSRQGDLENDQDPEDDP